MVFQNDYDEIELLKNHLWRRFSDVIVITSQKNVTKIMSQDFLFWAPSLKNHLWRRFSDVIVITSQKNVTKIMSQEFVFWDPSFSLYQKFWLRLCLLVRLKTNGRILKANLSWTRKKSNSSDAKMFLSVLVSFFCWTKSWTWGIQVWVLSG